MYTYDGSKVTLLDVSLDDRSVDYKCDDSNHVFAIADSNCMCGAHRIIFGKTAQVEKN